MYIVIGILKVCENAKISLMQLQKVQLGSQNVKKVKLYFLMYPDSHKDAAKEKNSFNILTFCVTSDQRKML